MKKKGGRIEGNEGRKRKAEEGQEGVYAIAVTAFFCCYTCPCLCSYFAHVFALVLALTHTCTLTLASFVSLD